MGRRHDACARVRQRFERRLGDGCALGRIGADADLVETHKRVATGVLEDVGEVWFADPETGQRVRVDTSDARLRQRFTQAAAEERGAVAAALAQVGASHVVLSTDGDWLRELAVHLRMLR